MRISAATVKWPLILVCVGGTFGCMLPTAWAGLATTPFALYDPAGPGPDSGFWRGSLSVDVDPLSPPAFPQEVEATAEWAMFAPGKFQDFLDAEFPGATAPAVGIGEVTYAYQITDIDAAVPGVTQLSVGHDIGDLARFGSLLPTSVALTGTAAPVTAVAQTTQAVWTFAGISAGSTSRILVYSSPFFPEPDSMMIRSTIAAGTGETASISDRTFTGEVPEPATLALVLFGVAGCLFGLRRARD